jgi:hypothetical protein
MAGQSMHLLQSVEDALVVDGFGENLGNDVSIVQSHIGDHDTGPIALGAQGQQESRGVVLGVVGVDLDGQQIVGVAVHILADFSSR